MKVRLSEIKADERYSARIEQGMSDKTVAQYKECLDQLPPIVVFQIEGETRLLLADGWHRFRAAKQLEREHIEADKKAGTLEEFKEYALVANLKHGRPLTRKERRHVIDEWLKLHPERTDTWIALDVSSLTRLFGHDVKLLRLSRKFLH